MGRNEVRRVLACGLVLATLFLSGCSGGSGEGTVDRPIQLEYYYVPSCESCKDGEALADMLRNQLGDALEDGVDYQIEMKNVSQKQFYEEFQQIAENYRTPDFYPTPPVLKVGSEYLFGLDQIDEMTRHAAIMQRNAALTPQQVEKRLGQADPQASVFVYFYKEGCSYCEEIEGYLAALEPVQYLEDGTSTPLKIHYVDAGNVDNMPLVGEMYDRYQVPEEERKSPMIFWKSGYAMGKDSIERTLVNTVISGEALGWPGWEHAPVS